MCVFPNEINVFNLNLDVVLSAIGVQWNTAVNSAVSRAWSNQQLFICECAINRTFTVIDREAALTLQYKSKIMHVFVLYLR